MAYMHILHSLRTEPTFNTSIVHFKYSTTRTMHLYIQIKPRKVCLFLVSPSYLMRITFVHEICRGVSGILDATRTSLGRRLLRNWFLRPSLSLSTIASRHDALSCFLRPENLVTANAMHSHLKGIGNVPHVFAQLRGGNAGVREWRTVVKVIYPFLM